MRYRQGVRQTPEPSGERLPRAAARQAGLRAHNLALVLDHVVRAGETPISRADIAASSGLTRATVSSLVELLLQARLVDWAAASPTSGAGRPASPVTLASATLAGLGLEIGANHLGAVVVDIRGETLAFREVRGDFTAPSPTAVLATAAELATATLTQAQLAHPDLELLGATLAVPGIVRDGVILDAPRLGWLDVDAGAALAGLGGLAAVGIGNEASLAALAESHARTPSTFLYLSGGVGIGGAHVVEGAVVGGVHGFASELGHVAVDPAGPLCRCGATGCLEQYAGAQALARLDPAEIGRALGIALASTVNVLDVATLVLGGTLAPRLEEFLPSMQAELELRVLAYPWAPVSVEAALVRETPSLRGAALESVLATLADPERRVLP